jgi:hypothetical protein
VQHFDLLAKMERGHETAATHYSVAQSEIWDLWQAGEPMSSIGRRFDRDCLSVGVEAIYDSLFGNSQRK